MSLRLYLWRINLAVLFLALSITLYVPMLLSLPTRLNREAQSLSNAFIQGVVLAAQPLIGVAHHLRRDERLTVGKTLIVLDDLRLDVVEREVGGDGFPALAFALLPFTSHNSFGDGALAAELSHRAVDCTRPMMGTMPSFSLLPFT